MSVIIGIDLGTTYSGAAVYCNDWLRMIPDKRGSVIIPSMVAFTERGTLVGEDVSFQMSHNAENSIYDAKRFIGRNFNDQSIQSGLSVKRWPFSIRQENDRIKMEVISQGKKENYLPEQISALILKRLKESCEDNLGQEIKDAVISVPAYFNDNQRVATKTAGEIAGLNVRRIVNEPTAAALAFGFGRSKFEKDETILIYDLGGGTFDVSIVNISGNNFLVRATTGDSNLGGQDFTNRLRNHCIEDFKRIHGIDILNNKLALLRLTEACENVKRRLSGRSWGEADIEITSICRNQEGVSLNYSTTITREQFEEMNMDSFNYTMDLVKSCLSDAKLSPSQIDEVVLVGGSTRIPKIQHIIEKYFSPQKVNKTLNPDEAVALGAAIEGAILSGNNDLKIRDLTLFDVTPLSLGLNNSKGEMRIYIKKNSIIPAKIIKGSKTHHDYQKRVSFYIYQGERAMVKDNDFLGKIELYDIRIAPRGETQFDVTFDLSTDGILTVTSNELKPDGSQGTNTKSITIENSIGRLSQNEIQKMIETAKQCEAIDKKFRRISVKRSQLDRYTYDVHKFLSLKTTKDKLSKSQHKDCETKNEAALKFLTSQKDCSLEDCEDWLEDLQEVCEPFIGKLFQEENGRKIGEHRAVVTSDIPSSQKSKYDVD